MNFRSSDSEWAVAEEKIRQMTTLKKWLTDWQFWLTVLSGVVFAIALLWPNNERSIRTGTVGPSLLAMRGVCRPEISAPDKILDAVLSQRPSPDRTLLLKKEIERVLNNYPYDDVSVGAWFVCPDSNSSLDSLWIKIRSVTAKILHAFAVNTSASSTDVCYGADSNSIEFKVPSLVSGEVWAIWLLSQGVTENPYQVTFPKGSAGYRLIGIAGGYSTGMTRNRYLFFGALGFFSACGIFLIVRRVGIYLLERASTRTELSERAIQDLMNRYNVEGRGDETS